MILHTKQGRNVCQDCGKVFTMNSTLKRHRCKVVQQAALLNELQSMSDGARPAPQRFQEVYIRIENREQMAAAASVEAEEQQVMVEVQEDITEEVVPPDGEGQEELVTYMCGICQQMFSTSHEVNQHIAQQHSGVTVVMEDQDGVQSADLTQTELQDGEPPVDHAAYPTPNKQDTLQLEQDAVQYVEHDVSIESGEVQQVVVQDTTTGFLQMVPLSENAPAEHTQITNSGELTTYVSHEATEINESDALIIEPDIETVTATEESQEGSNVTEDIKEIASALTDLGQ